MSIHPFELDSIETTYVYKFKATKTGLPFCVQSRKEFVPKETIYFTLEEFKRASSPEVVHEEVQAKASFPGSFMRAEQAGKLL